MPEINKGYQQTLRLFVLGFILMELLTIEWLLDNWGQWVLGAMMIVGIFFAHATIRLIQLLPGSLPWGQFIIGAALAFAGVLSDIVTVMLQAMDWDHQLCSALSVFVDLGFFWSEIYVFGFLLQILLFVITTLLWGAYTKAFPLIKPQLTGQQFGHAFFLITFLTPMLVVFALYRCYHSFVDFELLPSLGLSPWGLFLGTMIAQVAIISWRGRGLGCGSDLRMLK